MSNTARMHSWTWPNLGLSCSRAVIPPALNPFTYMDTIKTAGVVFKTENFPMPIEHHVLSGSLWDCAFHFPKVKGNKVAIFFLS